MNTRIALALIACTSFLPAQGLGGFLKKSAAPAASASKVDVGSALASGAEMIGFVTVATDQGMKAVDNLLEVFPAEKVAKVKKLSAQYAELSKKRKEGNIDAEQLKVASAAGDEMAALQGDWQSYKKEKSSIVGKANGRLGLVAKTPLEKLPLAGGRVTERQPPAGDPADKRNPEGVALAAGLGLEATDDRQPRAAFRA